MRYFFQFLLRNHFTLLFLALMVASLGLTLQYNEHPGAVFFRYATTITGTIQKSANRVTGYFNLIDENRRLAEQNARFLVALHVSKLNRDTTSITRSDTTRLQRFTYMTAKVVANSVTRRNNFIMIDKGSLDGVEKDMGVIGPDGVVGIVVSVAPHFSSVLSLLHEAALISAKHKATNQLGSVVWDGINFRRASLINLPVHVPLRIGDSVITSGFSIIFPEGIPIGKIRSFKPDQGDYYSVSLDLFTDFNALGWVYVVKNLFRHEQQQLIEEETNVVQPTTTGR